MAMGPSPSVTGVTGGGVRVGRAVVSAASVGVYVGRGGGVAVGSGVGVAVGCGVGVAVGSGVGMGVGVGSGVGVGVGSGVGIGRRVGGAVGVGVGRGPTLIVSTPPTVRSTRFVSVSTPENVYEPSWSGAMTVWVTSVSPKSITVKVWSLKVAALPRSEPTYRNPEGRISTICPRAPKLLARTVTRTWPAGWTHGEEKLRSAPASVRAPVPTATAPSYRSPPPKPPARPYPSLMTLAFAIHAPRVPCGEISR